MDDESAGGAGTGRRAVPRHLDLLFLAIASTLVTIRLALPDGTAATALVMVAQTLALVAFWFGLRRHRPQAAGIWYPLGVMLGLLLAGDVADAAGSTAAGSVLHVSGYAAAAVAAIRLLRHRGAGGDREGLVDALLLAIGGAIVMWQFVIEPNLSAAASASSRALVAAYPLVDVALFGLILRLLLSPGTRVRSLWYLVAALTCALVGDIGEALPAGSALAPAGVDALNVAARSFVAASTLTPSMRELTRRPLTGEGRLHPLRLTVLIACLLGLVIVLGLPSQLTGSQGEPVMVVGPRVLAGLMLLRLGWVIRDHERAQKRLADQVLRDPLTGLPNRLLLEQRVAEALERAGHTPHTVAVLFCDLDRFKLVNDSLGHRMGDEVLRQVASRLSSVLRSSDLVARVGADEFVVCCEDVGSAGGAEELAERLAAAVQRPVRLGGGADGGEVELFVSGSIGGVVGSPGVDARRLLQQADAAMYAAKRRGRGRTEMFTVELLDPLADRLSLEHDLRNALRAPDLGGLQIHLQEVRDLRSDRVVMHEALVRWRHPRHGWLGPDEFVPLAEESDLVADLGRWVLRQACADLAARRDAGVDGGAGVAVNVSPRQLVDGRLVDLVTDVLAEFQLPGHLLCLEITENLLITDVARAAGVLHDLAALGVQLALDDFGTGQASLASLQSLPVEVLALLKIDRSFVSGLVHDPTRRAIVAATVTLARSLGLRVVAEGIETPAQCALLVELGCDEGQGFLFSAPKPTTPAPGVTVDLVSLTAPSGVVDS